MKLSPLTLIGMLALAWWIGKQSAPTVDGDAPKSLEQQAKDIVQNLQKQGLQV